MKNQDIFRKLTAQELGTKHVYTSFLMLPLRMETLFQDRMVEEIYEPERIFYTLRKAWDLLWTMDKNYDGWTQKRIVELVKELHVEVEKLDVIYPHDKFILISILNKMRDLLPNMAEINDSWTALIHKVERLQSIESMRYNRATDLLNRLDRYTRRFITTMVRSPFNGKNRQSYPSKYSQSVFYKARLKHLKECRKFIKMLPEELEKVPWMTPSQIMKLEKLLSQWDLDYLMSQWNLSSVDDKTLENIRKHAFSSYSEVGVLKSVKEAKDYFEQEWAKIQEELYTPKKVSSTIKKITEKEVSPYRYTKAVGHIFSLVITAKKSCSKQINKKEVDILNAILENTVFDYDIQRDFIREELLHWLNTNLSANINYNILNKYSQFVFKKKMLYKTRKKCLCVRIYPDELAVTQAIRPLSENEYLGGRDFWLKYFYYTDTKTRESLWLSICDLWPAYRAAWIVRKTFPVHSVHKLLDQFAREFQNNKKTFNEFAEEINSNILFRDAFPRTNVDDSQQVFDIPATALLPDRFILQAVLRTYENKQTKKHKTTNICKYGHRLPKTLQLGINLNDKDQDVIDKDKTDGHIFLNGSLRWMTDYDEAERMGMAITLPLEQFAYEQFAISELKEKVDGQKKVVRLRKNERKPKPRSFFFDAVYVFGANNENEDQCKKMLTDLLEAHLYSDDGYSLLNIGTATNILINDDQKIHAELFDTSEEALTERYKHQPENCIDPPKFSPNEDLLLLNQLFALDRNVLGNIKDRNNTTEHHEIIKSREANVALINKIDNKIVELFRSNNTLNDFLSNDVLARGPFPPIRIGSQPYGILPICDFRKLRFPKSNPLYILKEILIYLTEKWNYVADNIVSFCAENDTVTADDYLKIAGSTPVSSYFQKVQSVKEKNEPILLLPEFFKFTDPDGNIETEQLEILEKIFSILNKNKNENDKITADNLKQYLIGFDEVPIIEEEGKNKHHQNFSNLQLPNLVHYVKLERLKGILNRFPDINTIISDKYEDFLSILNKDVTAEKIIAFLKRFVKIPSKLQSFIEAGFVKAIMSENWSDEEAKNRIIEFFDLFAYRLDAWMMGLLSNKLRERIKNGQHRIALGSYGWVFNLKDPSCEHKENKKKQESGEYILAPSVNQAITGAILRSAYNNSRINGKNDQTFSVNLSSERVRNAIRIIEGVQNGLAIGTILGTDLERLMHDEYNKSGQDLNEGIYKLRNKYPMVESKNKAQNKTQDKIKDNDITVVNGAKLLEDYRNAGSNFNFVKELDKELDVFSNNKSTKEQALWELIKRIDDEYDALTDVVLSEGVYKLTQGQSEAVDALMQSLDTGKNIPMPQVAEIPISSAQVDGSLVVALPLEVETNSNSLLAKTEPKVDQWINNTLGTSKLMMSFRAGDSFSTKSMQDLGISASEMVYLSANKSSFLRYLELKNWLEGGIYESFTKDIEPDGCTTYDELELMLDNTRGLLTGARILRNDDLVKETGLSDGAEYDTFTLAKRYNEVSKYVKKLINNISKLLEQQKNPEEEGYDTTAINDDTMKKALQFATQCFSIGQTTAVDTVCEELLVGKNTLYIDSTAFLKTVKAQHTFFEKMETINENLNEALDEAAKIVDNATEKTYQTYTDAIQKLLVSNMLIVPSFKPSDSVPINLLKEQKSPDYFKNVSNLTVDENIQSLSKVSPQMMRFHQLRLFQKWNAVVSKDKNEKPTTIIPMQIPVIGDKPVWLGTEVENEDYVNDAFTYMVAQPENFPLTDKYGETCFAGFVLDHWIERIPYREQTAGLAFNFDQPDAEAPQALLLAISDKYHIKNGRYNSYTKILHNYWSEDMLIRTLRSAMHLVKCRSVEPDDLKEYAWTAGLFPLINYSDNPSK